MPLKDKIAHAGAVAKWKADQQARLYKIQTQINELEQMIRGEKSNLADTALSLFGQDNLSDDELKQICSKITELSDQIKEKQRFQEAIKQERPPEYVEYTSKVAEKISGLVCPECGRELVGQYCPDHGVAGVKKSQGQEKLDKVIEAPITEQLVCPICRKSLAVRFCPDHGVEGVPANQT